MRGLLNTTLPDGLHEVKVTGGTVFPTPELTRLGEEIIERIG